MSSGFIQVKGARANNLKNISVQIPHHALSIVCGVSGSGKSSLIYDVIGKEGQRLFFDYFMPGRAKQLLKLERPDVDEIQSLHAVVALNQRSVGVNPRSTGGTIGGLWDLIRLLFARFAESDIILGKASRSHFSFNTVLGQCPKCKGLGLEDRIDPDLLVGDENLSLREGALVLTTPNNYIIYSQITMQELEKVCEAEGFSVDTPWKDLTEENKNIIYYGSEKITVLFGKHTLESRLKWKGITAKPREEGFYKGLLPIMEEILRRDRNPNILRFARSYHCSECNGTRFNENTLSWKWNGLNIDDIHRMSVKQLHDLFSKLNPAEEGLRNISENILRKCTSIIDLGASYLTLNREASSLSAGEMNRIRLASYSTANMRNVFYILDEPGTGLHAAEQRQMMKVIRRLVNNGNTVLMVDHHEHLLPLADYIVEIGPGAGNAGGEVLFQGSTKDYFGKNIDESRTQKCISQKLEVNQSTAETDLFSIDNACLNNLKNINVRFRKGAFNTICGMSGAGKTSLAETIRSQIEQKKAFGKIIFIDQKAFGRSPRSNPATYTGLSDVIRNLFASVSEAKSAGLTRSHFSFAVKGGRCEDCGGAGVKQIGMHFLGNVEIPCETCDGKRFQPNVLDIKYHGKNIYEVLELSFDEALTFFSNENKALKYIEQICTLGLGYVKLGQPSTSLSGGEAQRVKLASELVKSTKNEVLFILDEPANGLHAYDVSVLVKALRDLTKKGHTLIAVEHDLRFLAQSDHIVEIGPGSGEAGGEIVFEGSVLGLLKENSVTAMALQEFFAKDHLKETTEKTDLVSEKLILKNIQTNNLKIDELGFEEGRIYAIGGPSGAGKSSLLFDTIHVLAHEELSSGQTARLKQYSKVKGQALVEEYSGLMPVIALDKKSAPSNPRSTIATYTGIFDLYRLLFSRFGKKDDGSLSQLYSTAFSFNNEQGACMHCKGLGFEILCDPEKLVSNPELPLVAGALDGSKEGKFYGDPKGQYVAALIAVGKSKGIDYSSPFKDLSLDAQAFAMHGCDDEEFDVEWNYKRGKVEGTHKMRIKWPGFCGHVDEEYQRKHADKRGEQMMSLMSEKICEHCHSWRLEPERLEYKIAKKNIGELTDMDAAMAFDWFSNQNFPNGTETLIKEILSRLDSLIQAGISYASLSRISSTLSGGEFQRLRLAGVLKSPLSGVLYVMDEPGFGLSMKDSAGIQKLIKALHEKGNTIILSDHNPDILEMADEIIELGPGGGENGGQLIGKGNGKEFLQKMRGIINGIQPLISPDNTGISIQSANIHNVKNLDISFPANTLSVLSGNSGSGKTSILQYVIHESFERKRASNCADIQGIDLFNEHIFIEQDIYAGSTVSIPLTYLGLFDEIRKFFAAEAKSQNIALKASHFSFFTRDGQCPQCQGSGIHKVSLDFISDAVSACEMCGGDRYNAEVLNFSVDGFNISQLMNLTLKELGVFLENHFEKKIFAKVENTFRILNLIGLGYLSGNQNLNTLSSGEMQRLKLIKRLLELNSSNALILLDEPGSGLHPSDMQKMLGFFDYLLEEGHTIIAASHNPMIIKRAGFGVRL